MEPTLELDVRRGSGPLHVAIAEQLSAAIAAGTLAPGMRLPPERELAATLGVSRMTVRQALGELEREGRLRRVVGRAGGTFVSDPAEGASAPNARSLSAELRRQAGANGIEVVSAVVEPAGRRAAAALELKRADRVVVVTRLRLASGKPVAVQRSTLPAQLFPDLEDMDLEGSLTDLMRQGFGIVPVRAVERLELVEARPSDSRALGVRRESLLVLVERVLYTAEGVPVEFARDRFRPERCRIVIETSEVQE